MRAASLVLCCALAACTQFPELDDVVGPDVETADFPTLVPLDIVQSAATPVVAEPEQTTQTLKDRVNALRARASALQGRPIVDPATRARLRDGIG